MITAPEVRPATESDVKGIHQLLALYAAKQIVLPRSEAEIRAALGNFFVAELDGEVIGCVALRDFGNGLFEVRSLVVKPEFQKHGAGRRLVECCIAFLERKVPGYRLFALTYQQQFFRRLNFEIVDRELFPEKIWSDCAGCPKRDCCDEIAVLYRPGATAKST